MNFSRRFLSATLPRFVPRTSFKAPLASIEPLPDSHDLLPPPMRDALPDQSPSHRPTTRTLPVGTFESELLVRKFLNFKLDLPIALVERLIRQRNIWVLRADGKRERNLDAKTQLFEGDIVHVRHTFDDTRAKPSLEQLMHFPLMGTQRDLLMDAITYKDDDILIINKPGNLAVHAGSKTTTHLQRFFSALQMDAVEPPRLVHRLDKRTSGLMILARNRIAAMRLSEMFRSHASPPHLEVPRLPSVDAFGNLVGGSTKPKESPKPVHDSDSLQVEKTYWAITTDVPPEMRGTLERHLFIPPDANISIADGVTDFSAPEHLPRDMGVTIMHPNRVSPWHHHCLKHSITNYEVIDTIGKKGAWLRLQPQTGRKHQLRVHCSQALHAPILGDLKYGVASFRDLHTMGWGQVFDFSKWTGVKATEDGMPMFLHLRHIVIRNYFKHLGSGGKPHLASADLKKNPCRVGDDLVVVAPLPEAWKDVFKACSLDASKHIK
jgi:23S rRNA pseudouridine955/2504/2580 synthase